jgi:hypothetical protein
MAAVSSFNQGDLKPLADLLADNCIFYSSAGLLGESRDQIMARLQEGRDAGWTRHSPISVSAAGDFLSSLYRNDFADGTSVIAGGIIRYGEDGSIVELRSLEPPDFVARTAGTSQ